MVILLILTSQEKCLVTAFFPPFSFLSLQQPPPQLSAPTTLYYGPISSRPWIDSEPVFLHENFALLDLWRYL